MANKKSRIGKPNKTGELQHQRRTRILQILFAAFCLLVVLSMVLAAVSK
jgi:hypothetical protein